MSSRIASGVARSLLPWPAEVRHFCLRLPQVSECRVTWCDPSLYDGLATSRRPSEGTKADFEMEEIKPLLVLDCNTLRTDAISCAHSVFDYLNRRVIGDTQANLD